MFKRVFDFDGEVMKSKVYEGHMRSLIKRIYQKRPGRPPTGESLGYMHAPQYLPWKARQSTDLAAQTFQVLIKNEKLGVNGGMEGPFVALVDRKYRGDCIARPTAQKLGLRGPLVGENEYKRPARQYESEHSERSEADKVFRVVDTISHRGREFDMQLGGNSLGWSQEEVDHYLARAFSFE